MHRYRTGAPFSRCDCRPLKSVVLELTLQYLVGPLQMERTFTRDEDSWDSLISEGETYGVLDFLTLNEGGEVSLCFLCRREDVHRRKFRPDLVNCVTKTSETDVKPDSNLQKNGYEWVYGTSKVRPIDWYTVRPKTCTGDYSRSGKKSRHPSWKVRPTPSYNDLMCPRSNGPKKGLHSWEQLRVFSIDSRFFTFRMVFRPSSQRSLMTGTWWT